MLAARKSKGRLKAPKAKAPGTAIIDEIDPELAAQAIAGSTAEAVAARMSTEALSTYQALSIGGVLPPGAAATASTLIFDTLRRLSTAADLRQAQKDVNSVFGLGRAQEGRAQADAVEGVFSNLLESMTCGPCAAQDGRTFPLSRLDEFATPYRDCEGGDMCNCLVLFTRK